ncbi:MAG: VOC family protein, partial [Providencia sp.]
MSVIGIEKMEFGVEDVAACTRFFQDFGLHACADNPTYFTTLSGAGINVSPLDDNTLPAPFES